MSVDLAVACRNALGEAPVWNVAEQSLYWVDCTASRLFALRPDGAVDAWDLGEYPGSYAFRADGRGLVVAFRRGLALIDLGPPGSVDRPGAIAGRVDIADPVIDLRRGRFNDGACDRRGRFWTGQLDRQPAPEPCVFLYRLDPDLSVRRMDGGIGLSNGIAFSPDDTAMYHADTHARKVYRSDYDIGTGINCNKRIFLDYADRAGAPDGLTVDAEGCLWVAEPGSARVSRYTPDGRCDRSIVVPVDAPTSVMFGGADLATLFVTSATVGEGPLEGALLAVRPGVCGLPEPRFGGPAGSASPRPSAIPA